MPAPLVWTHARDSLIRRMRAEGHSWDGISAALGISRWAAIERGRRIGARKPDAPAPDPRPQSDPAREPLPAGHPLSWGLITAGTLLDGLRYPYPPLPAAPLAATREAA